MSAPVRSVYVHAPFCARRCAYCDFAVHVDARPDAAAWVDAIAREWALLRDLDEAPMGLLRTLYVGGGTPSLLGVDAMEGLRAIFSAVLPSSGLEWTVEANPESFDAPLGDAWRRTGVNRLSFGVQSFDPAALRWMGRLHGPDGAERAVGLARAAGFDNLSLDLIFALPLRLERNWREDLERALALEPEHISLYGLGVEARTPLGRAVAEGREAPVDEGQYREEFLTAVEVLGAAGYQHYEVSNFALPGRQSAHNQVYWSGEPYLGLGNGAHSYRPPRRRWNLRDWAEYRERVHSGHLPREEEEVVEGASRRLERIWLGLRIEAGLEMRGWTPLAMALVERWVDSGWAERTSGRVRLTSEGWLLLDELAVALDGTLATADPLFAADG
ncbi:MAG: radical SAM family heme chaperone HemW [Gemmatimonadota bacterium]